MPTLRPLFIWLLLVASLLPLLGGCHRSDDQAAPSATVATPPAKPVVRGCKGCHPMTLDAAHSFSCATCHGGDETASDGKAAHAGLIPHPAHPDRMQTTCGRCHGRQTSEAAQSRHFTLAGEINSVRRAFGATTDLKSPLEIPVTEPPTTPLALADDLLRRRCLRCHPYHPGDPYPETRHGTGCAACHLDFGNGVLTSHAFVRSPGDGQCLHCHSGNRVGADYYGRFQRDFAWEFRTPYRTDNAQRRPYGVEDHQLRPDVHHLAGIGCIDCHPGARLMGGGHASPTPPLTCGGCHAWRPGQPPPAANLIVDGKRLLLVTKRDQRQLVVPAMQDPAHRAFGAKATCVACHAQWSFNDRATHLLRQDSDDYEPWSLLTVQGSHEVELQLENNLAGEGDDSDPSMVDKFSGARRPGLWLKGFELRRWEEIPLCRDNDGRLTVCRPSLDLHLSYVNDQGEVLFDAVAPTPSTRTLRPYTPHTIGKAGAHYRQRLKGTATLSPLQPTKATEKKTP